jgi:hypothetical protein
VAGFSGVTETPEIMIPLVSMVQVQLGVAAEALALAILGFLAYLFRCSLGLVKPPPPEEETQHQGATPENT